MPAQNSRPRLFLKHVRLRGFKSIEDLQTDIKPGLNILIGKNGAGKSNFFEFLNMASASIYSTDFTTFKSAELQLVTGEEESINYKISRLNTKPVSDEDPLPPYRQTVELAGNIIYDTADENLKKTTYKGRRISQARNIHSLFISLHLPYRRSKYIGFAFPSQIEGLSSPMVMEIPFDYGDYWGNVGSLAVLNGALAQLKSKMSDELYSKVSEDIFEEVNEEWNKIVNNLTPDGFLASSKIDEETLDNLKKFSPIQDLRLNKNVTFFKNDTHLVIDNIRLDFLVNDNWLPWSQLSDGTKRLFLIITEVSLSTYETILLEEPELGVHPHQFDMLMQFLKEQSEDKQIILSTHSPKALDILLEDELDSIMLVSYQKGKGTQISHLNEEQKAKAIGYMDEVGYLSDYWLMSDLES